VVLWLKPSARLTLPAGMGQIGRAGAPVWLIPQTQNPDLIWLGWSTEGLNSANAIGPVSWRLTKAEGPGQVSVYLSGAFGGVQEVVFPGSAYDIDLGVHAHANWAFTAPGVYRLTMTQQVTLANGARSSDTETLTVAVGDVDPAAAAPEGAGCGAAAAVLTADAVQAVLKSAPQAAAPASAAAPADPATGAGDGGEPARVDPSPRQPGRTPTTAAEARPGQAPRTLLIGGAAALAASLALAGLHLARRRAVK
jgi:putative ABC transporter-associated repeat protein